MKTLAHAVAWTFALATVIYAAAHPDSGVLWHSPLATLGVGLIGLGLCVDARRRMQPATQPADRR